MLKKKWIKTITVLKIIFYENNLMFVKVYDVMACERVNKGNKVEKRLVIIGIKYCLEQNYHSWNFAIVNTFNAIIVKFRISFVSSFNLEIKSTISDYCLFTKSFMPFQYHCYFEFPAK